MKINDKDVLIGSYKSYWGYIYYGIMNLVILYKLFYDKEVTVYETFWIFIIHTSVYLIIVFLFKIENKNAFIFEKNKLIIENNFKLWNKKSQFYFDKILNIEIHRNKSRTSMVIKINTIDENKYVVLCGYFTDEEFFQLNNKFIFCNLKIQYYKSNKIVEEFPVMT